MGHTYDFQAAHLYVRMNLNNKDDGARMTIVGSGKYTYRLVPDWAKLPGGETFAEASEVAVDSQDRVYVGQHKAEPPVMVFDREGTYLGSWGNGAFIRLHGFHIADDILYLTDTDASVVLKYTLDGKPIQVMGQRGVHSDTGTEKRGEMAKRAAGPFNYPTKAVPTPSGELYVSDGERNCRVHKFSADGQLIASWGEPGKAGPNEFHLVHGILVDVDGRVYVCDRENARVQVFSADGEFITNWTGMCPPCDIVVDGDGVFYICTLAFNATHRYEGVPAPAGTGSALTGPDGRRTMLTGGEPQISVRDRDGNILAEWNCRSGHSLCVDSRGDIYLVTEDDSVVDKYVRVG